MRAGHRQRESQDLRTCSAGARPELRLGRTRRRCERPSGRPGEDSAPGWLCAAYDEHPGAGIDNHNAGRNRRSAVHVIRGAQ
jgi:hypothetical protein